MRVEAEEHRVINWVNDELMNVEDEGSFISDVEVDRSEAQADPDVDKKTHER